MDEETRTRQPLPKEAERRRPDAEDADASGTPVTLQGGEAWYIPHLTFSDRGGRIFGLMDQIQTAEVGHATAQRAVDLRADALERCEDVDELEGLGRALEVATEKRDKAVDQIQRLQRELVYHALRGFYRVSRDEADALCPQRVFDEILAALNGQETKEAQVQQALEILRRAREEGAPEPGRPFVPETSGAGAGVS